MFMTPEETESAFYDALRSADLQQMMAVWADDEDVVCIHPGGLRVVGPSAVQAAWQQIFANGPIAVYTVRPQIISNLMTSVHVLIEQVIVDTNEGNQTVNCYTTNVYHKGPSGWKMILHHASNAPLEADMLDMRNHPDTLH